MVNVSKIISSLITKKAPNLGNVPPITMKNSLLFPFPYCSNLKINGFTLHQVNYA